MTTSFIRNSDDGEQLWFAGGGVFTMKATSTETGGSLLVFEDRVVKGKTTPMHLHPDADEMCYVLEGSLIAHIDGKNYEVRKGGMFFAARGAAHSFLITSDTAHLLCIQTPGSGEDFYRSVSEPATSSADASRPPDLARLRAGAMASPTIELLGPPPFK
jgi:quercetin dioxygenase-like cupin family protein